jgi:predicted RNA-binding protein with PUA-like domain
VAYWLVKTEPSVYSFDSLVRDGRSVWDGVTNALALKYLRSMTKGDLALLYHTGSEKALVGTAEVLSNPYPDPKGGDPKLTVVDLGPGSRLPRSVPLAEIKNDRQFAGFELVRLPRLSIMPVEVPVWNALLKLSKRQPGKL